MTDPKEYKSFKTSIVTPVGIINYPYLHTPDTKFNDKGKFKASLLLTKEDLASEAGLQLKRKVLELAREYFKDDKITFKDFNHPFRDLDKLQENLEEPLKGKIELRAQTSFKPRIVDAAKQAMSTEAIEGIKSGDFCRFIVNIYGYPKSKLSIAGLGFNLEVVQFVRVGEPIAGVSTKVNMLDDIEVKLDDLDTESSTEESFDI